MSPRRWRLASGDWRAETGEKRDRNSPYKRARECRITASTGISDRYEAPETPELRVETVSVTPDDCAQDAMLKLEQLSLIG